MRKCDGCDGSSTKSLKKRDLRISGDTRHTRHSFGNSLPHANSKQLLRTGEKSAPGTMHRRSGRGAA